MPLHEFPSEQGKLYIEYVVAFPTQLSDEQKEGKFEITSNLFINYINKILLFDD